MASDQGELLKEMENQDEANRDESAVYSGELTPLQKHVAFFDRDKDGLIYPSETYKGMRAIGVGVPLAIFSAVFINGALGPKTSPGKFPSLKFPIYVKNIKNGKHGSDYGAYDSEGRFVSEKFEKIFVKYAKTNPDSLTSKELQEMLKGNRDPKDYPGWIGALVEWKVLYSLCKGKDGLLKKEIVRGVYDGSLFMQLEEKNQSK